MDKYKLYKDYKTILAVNSLIWCKGKVLLLKRSKNKDVEPGIYSGIGGKVEPGEDFYSAILREIKEETGITKLKSIRPFSITQHPYPPVGAEGENVYFYITIENQVNIPESKDGTFGWFNPKEVKMLKMTDDLKKYVEILFKNPNVFILGYYNYNKFGRIINKKIKVF